MTRANPYIGPRSFKTGELLYGRDSELDELCSLLIAERIVLLHSPSGAGKTSIIQAGLIPKLIEDFNILPPVRVNQDLSETVGVNPYVLSVLFSLEEGLNDEQRQPLEALDVFSLDAYLSRRPRPENAPSLDLLIFDQFEEILTTNPVDRAGKELFFEQLGEALRNPNRWALFAIREDYLGPLDPYLLPVPNRLKTTYRLDLLGLNAAGQAIRSPALEAGVEYTDEALQLLLDDLRAVKTQRADGTTLTELGQYIEPVQLQVACYRLWDNLNEEDLQISESDVRLAGDVNTALSIYYADCLQRIALETGVQEKIIRQWFNDNLITAQDIRGQVLMAVGQSEGLENTVISRLIDVHLVRAERRAGVVWYELAHDRLVQPVRQDNAEWYGQNLNPLQIQAALWAKARGTIRSTLLLRDSILDKAEIWARDHLQELSAVDQEFLEICLEERERLLLAQSRQTEMRTNLDETGWGIIFPAGEINPQLLEALRPLLELRRKQAGSKNPAYYHEFKNDDGYQAGETADGFLARHKVGYKKKIERVSYYLLIVGDPEAIPFEFQYSLGTRYAVGRIYFETLEEYSNYARSVVLAETGQVVLPRKATLWSVTHPDDRATKMMLDDLATPLSAFMKASKSFANWNIELLTGEQTDKAGLAQLMTGMETPALLFTTSRGMNFKPGDPRWTQDTGALLCREWPGPKARVPVKSDLYFSAQDVPSDANLNGSIVFLCASYSAGISKYDNFFLQAFGTSKQIAERALLARLPQQLLGHPNGSVLAVIGHVEPIWGSSMRIFGRERGYIPEQDIDESEISNFEDLYSRLADGYTVGAAMEPFSQRYYFLATKLTDLLFDIKRGLIEEDDLQMATDFTTLIDARNYIILGDPAVRLPVARRGQTAIPRPGLEQSFAATTNGTPISIILSGEDTGVATQKPVEQPASTTQANYSILDDRNKQRSNESRPATSARPKPGPLMTNGVDATTGEYLLPPIDHHLIVQIARGQKLTPEDLKDANLRRTLDRQAGNHF